MRVALLSDIHGNLVALEAILADLAATAPDTVICLGDVAVTGNDHHLKIRIGKLEAGGKRQRPAVSGMKRIQAEIPGHAARTTDAGNH